MTSINNIENQIYFLNGIIKGYTLGKNKILLNLNNLLNKIKELEKTKELEESKKLEESKESKESKESNNSTELNSSTQDEPLNNLELTPENILKLETEKNDLQEQIKKIENIYTILKKKK